MRDDAELRRTALATLRSGASFLSGRAEQGWLADPWPTGRGGMVRARLFANWLRELDGFLHVVMDAVDGRTAPFDEERRSVAHRLAVDAGGCGEGGVGARAGTFRAQGGRLLALQRSHYTFWHYGGVVRRADTRGGRWLTCGWQGAGGGPGLRRFGLGERLAFDGADLLDVCRFYDAFATRLCEGAAD